MNIVFVSTWLQKCGIATYTWDLAHALKNLGHSITILTENLPFDQRRTYEGIPSYPVWYRLGSSKTIVDCVRSSKTLPDIICFQHEYGLFPYTEDLFQTIQTLEGLGIKVVTTLHTVKPGYIYSGFHKTVVHTPEAAFFVPDSTVIPHGVTINFPTEEEKVKAKLALNLQDYWKVFLSPGFITKGKGIQHTIESFLGGATDEELLIVSGECRDDALAEEITTSLLVRGHTSRIRLDLTYAEDKKRDLYFKASNAVILGRERDSPYSASGQIATALGYGLPILAREAPIHRDGGALLYRGGEHGEGNELPQFIENINESVLGYLSARSRKIATERSWDIVAMEYEKVFS